MKPRKPEKIGDKFKLTRINPSERPKMAQNGSLEPSSSGPDGLTWSRTGTGLSGPSGFGLNDTVASGRDEIDQLEKRLRANQSTRPNRGQRITNLISMFQNDQKVTEKVTEMVTEMVTKVTTVIFKGVPVLGIMTGTPLNETFHGKINLDVKIENSFNFEI